MVKKNIFLISLVFTIIIFVAGLFLGLVLDDYRSNSLLTSLQYNDLETESYLVHETLLQDFGGDKCAILDSRINDMKNIVNNVGRELTGLDDKKTFDSELDFIKRKYILSEIKFFILINELKANCDKNYIPILFFYTKDNGESTNQGYALTEINRMYEEEIFVLSIDKDYLDEPLVNTLKLKFNITEPTTLIIDSKIKKEGFTSIRELQDILVNLF